MKVKCSNCRFMYALRNYYNPNTCTQTKQLMSNIYEERECKLFILAEWLGIERIKQKLEKNE